MAIAHSHQGNSSIEVHSSQEPLGCIKLTKLKQPNLRALLVSANRLLTFCEPITYFPPRAKHRDRAFKTCQLVVTMKSRANLYEKCHQGPEPQHSGQCSQTVSLQHIHTVRCFQMTLDRSQGCPTYFLGSNAANYKARKPTEYAVP